MYIRLPEATRELYDEEILGEDADPLSPDEDDDNVVRVSAQEGEALVEKYPGIRIEEDEREGETAETPRDTDDDSAADDEVAPDAEADETAEVTTVEAEDPGATAAAEADADAEESLGYDDPDAAEGRDDPDAAEVEAVDGDLADADDTDE